VLRCAGVICFLSVVLLTIFTPQGSPLTATYQNWRQDSFIGNLGNAIATVIESIPSGGVLVFLPSYATLKKCVTRWQSQQETKGWQVSERSREEYTIWGRLVASKGKVIVEPTGSQNDFELAREEYARTISTTGSCVLLAVFRGKMSEGISFNDENARGVICVGIPFPHAFSRPITAKKAYNDEQRRVHKRMEVLSGSEWYAQQAFRAIAQALGRCIRHASDYGTIVLMDSRHCDVGGPREGDLCQAHLRLPKWMRHHVKNLTMRSNADACTKSIHGGWAGLQQEMKRFFTEAPIHAQHVRDEQAMHLIKSQAQSSGSHQFDVKTGSWTSTVPIAPDATHLKVSQDSVPNLHSIFAPQTPISYHSPEPEARVNKEVKMVT
jgi:Helicase C-terminal domain